MSFDDYKRFDFILLGDNKLNLRKFIKEKFSKTHKEYFAVKAFHNISFNSKKIFSFFLPTIYFKEKVIVLKKIDKNQNL